MKTSWYCLTLSQQQVDEGFPLRCKEQMEKAFAAAHGPRTMALFRRDLDGGGMELFFTPECVEHAAELVRQWGGEPCERPSLVGLQLVVGHHEITYYMP